MDANPHVGLEWAGSERRRTPQGDLITDLGCCASARVSTRLGVNALVQYNSERCGCRATSG